MKTQFKFSLVGALTLSLTATTAFATTGASGTRVGKPSPDSPAGNISTGQTSGTATAGDPSAQGLRKSPPSDDESDTVRSRQSASRRVERHRIKRALKHTPPDMNVRPHSGFAPNGMNKSGGAPGTSGTTSGMGTK